jgi:type VI secretion system ImpB/VipA family protein
MSESIQHKLDRVRPPRVQITYDVETLGSIVKTELPFVVGIMADLSGNGLKNPVRDQPDHSLKDRKYVEIDRDSLNTIMEKIKPRVKLNTGTYRDKLEFTSLDDFDPQNVLGKVPTLKAKLDSRIRLSNLLAKLDGNPELQGKLMAAIKGLLPDEKTKLDSYIETHLNPTGSQAEGATEPDWTKLSEDDQDELKVYIVKNFPDTTIPDLKKLADSLTAEDKTKLTKYIVKKYPLSLLTKLSADDKRVLPGFIAQLSPSTASTQTDQKAPAPPDPNAPPPDPKPLVEALGADDQTKVFKEFTPKLPTDLPTLLDALGSYEQDEVKSFAVALKSAKVTPVSEGGIGELEDLRKALSTDDRQEFTKHVLSQYPATKGDVKS